MTDNVTVSRELLRQALEDIEKSRETAMHQVLIARIPECGLFGCIAQDLDWVAIELRAALEQPAAIVGAVCEEGVRYPVATVDCDQYDQGGDSLHLAKFYATANPAAILALLDRLEAAEKDAARYRAIAADPYFDGYAWWTQDICIIETDDANKPPTKDQVDEAVDAAMKDEQK